MQYGGFMIDDSGKIGFQVNFENFWERSNQNRANVTQIRYDGYQGAYG